MTKYQKQIPNNLNLLLFQGPDKPGSRIAHTFFGLAHIFNLFQNLSINISVGNLKEYCPILYPYELY